MPKEKKRGDTVASSRSPKATDENDNNKQTGAQAQELPEWAKDLPDEITVRTWEID